MTYTPHGECLSWDPLFVWSSVVGDSLTFIAFMVISIGLLRMCYSAKPPSFAIVMFGSFIFLCGVGHMFNILTMWIPAYELTATNGLLTGIVSIYVAYLMMFRFGSLFLYFREADRAYGEVNLPPSHARRGR